MKTPIRKRYKNNVEFLDDLREDFNFSGKGLKEPKNISPDAPKDAIELITKEMPHVRQHYVIAFPRKQEGVIEIGFHQQFADVDIQTKPGRERNVIVKRLLRKAYQDWLKEDGFKLEEPYRTNGARLYKEYRLDRQTVDRDLKEVKRLLSLLISKTKPCLDKILWGRT